MCLLYTVLSFRDECDLLAWIIKCGCSVGYASESRLDRSGTTISERPSATRPTDNLKSCSFFFTFILHRLSPLSFHFSPHCLPLDAQDNCERIMLLPVLTASRLSFLSFHTISLLRTSANDNQHLAAAAWHQCALNAMPRIFLSFY